MSRTIELLDFPESIKNLSDKNLIFCYKTMTESDSQDSRIKAAFDIAVNEINRRLDQADDSQLAKMYQDMESVMGESNLFDIRTNPAPPPPPMFLVKILQFLRLV